MNTLALIAASSAGPTLAGQVITTIITFLLVLFVLKKFALGPVLALLDERKDTVANEFRELDRKVAAADARLKEYEEKLRRIDEEARERQNKAIDEGRRMATELLEKAKAESEAITSKARAAMQQEVEAARLSLRREAVEMTLSATGKLLQANLDDARQRQLVDGFISELEKRA